MPDQASGDDVAVLISGGIDSAVLCVDLVARGRRVFPLYVRFGLRWEQAELASVRRFLHAVERPGLMPLQILDEPVADIYGPHWSTDGSRVPDARSDDEAVYLPGRNVLLIAKAAVWCMLRDVDELALGCLQSNPFPDSTPAFLSRFPVGLEPGDERPDPSHTPAGGATQGGRHTHGGKAPLAPYVFMPESGGRSPLRRLQQVRGASTRFPQGGRDRRDPLCGLLRIDPSDPGPNLGRLRGASGERSRRDPIVPSARPLPAPLLPDLKDEA